VPGTAALLIPDILRFARGGSATIYEQPKIHRREISFTGIAPSSREYLDDIADDLGRMSSDIS